MHLPSTTFFIKACLSLLAIFSLHMDCFAQSRLQGRVTDGQQTLPFATVMLLNPDSTLVEGAITDQKGVYVFEKVMPGFYLLSSSLIGYARYTSQRILVEEQNRILPDIILREIATELHTVEVKAEKPVFEQHTGKLVMHVQGSITSSGNTILEVLQKSPGIQVNRQSSSITMHGKSGVQVMIDGKMLQLPADVVVGMLDGMSAANVEKIELITAPPSKYDANGSAGMIHIITREKMELGTSGAIGLTAGIKWAETLGGNASLNHQGKKTAWFLDYSLMRTHNLHRMEMRQQVVKEGFIQVVTDESPRENLTTQQNLSAGIEWKLSKSASLSAGFTGYRRNWDLQAITYDTNVAAPDSTVNTRMNIHESNIWQSGAGTIGFQKRVNEKSNLSLNMDYLYYHNNNPSSYNNQVTYGQHDKQEDAQLRLKKTTPIQFLVAKVDYQYRVSPAFSLETGLKGVSSTLANNVLVQRQINGEWMADPVFTSYANLREQTGAVYLSGDWQPEAAWQVNTGFRYEYTHTVIHTPARKNLVNRKYGYLFPSLSVKKTLNKEKDIEFSYARRLTRPTYNDIAPYVFFWGPSTLSSGNISLWPAISDALKAGYRYKQWMVSLQFSYARREMNGLQPEYDPGQNMVIYRSQNLKALQTLALTNACTFSPAHWWEVQTNLTVQHHNARSSNLPQNITMGLYGVNLHLVSIWKLPKDFSLEVSGMYQSKSLAGITQFGPMGSLNAGIKKTVDKVGTFLLAADDLLYTTGWKIMAYSPQNNLDILFKYDWHNQYIRLTFMRNIGNTQLKAFKIKSGSDEERNRVN